MSTVLQNDKAIKSATRAVALQRRNALSPERHSAKGRRIAQLVMGLDVFKAAQSVLLYAAFRTEVPTDELIWVALGMGKKVLVPKVDKINRSLSKHVIECLSELEAGYQGIPEPRTDTCWKVEDIEMIVIPGVAFDAQGHRIGYGGGYYDRLLPRVKGLRPIAGLAFEEQMFDHVPTEAHDITVDLIITDTRIITCHG